MREGLARAGSDSDLDLGLNLEVGLEAGWGLDVGLDMDVDLNVDMDLGLDMDLNLDMDVDVSLVWGAGFFKTFLAATVLTGAVFRFVIKRRGRREGSVFAKQGLLAAGGDWAKYSGIYQLWHPAPAPRAADALCWLYVYS